jgi:hypothetical protein
MVAKRSKKRTNKRQSPSKKSQVVSRRKRSPTSGRMNPEASQYARLLCDPCFGALSGSPYRGLSGTKVQRFTNSRQNFQSYGVYFYHPFFGVFYREDGASNNPGTFAQDTGFDQPCKTGSGRPVAGCLSVSFVGAESGRSGLIACGLVSGSQVWNFVDAASGGGGTSSTIDSIFNRISHRDRTPVDRCEVNWVPGIGDAEVYTQTPLTNNTINAQMAMFGRTNFVCIVNYGAGSLNIKATSVTELTGAQGNEPYLVTAPTSPRFDYLNIVNQLYSKDPAWYVDTFKKLAGVFGGVAASYGSMGLPGALGYLTSKMGPAINRAVQYVLT